ncbi:MAG: MTAP family purine nucleoside phosphorylase, partial [Chloroflexi bacterium]|nr:MTAP family purine nucleoside phosphorylase [Chloroflexota bacterium]
MDEVRPPALAIIGGTGLYQMEGLTDVRTLSIPTPFGPPSAPILVGELSGKSVAFLTRHGEGHHLLPHEINYRANIFALKVLGVPRIVGLTACGSLREEIVPGDFVLPDQIFDRTRQRVASFFGDGLVAHIAFAHPYCPELS